VIGPKRLATTSPARCFLPYSDHRLPPPLSAQVGKKAKAGPFLCFFYGSPLGLGTRDQGCLRNSFRPVKVVPQQTVKLHGYSSLSTSKLYPYSPYSIFPNSTTFLSWQPARRPNHDCLSLGRMGTQNSPTF